MILSVCSLGCILFLFFLYSMTCWGNVFFLNSGFMVLRSCCYDGTSYQPVEVARDVFHGKMWFVHRGRSTFHTDFRQVFMSHN
jgi:hypothetical protein